MVKANIGSRWGSLIILEKLGFDKSGHRFVRCLCDCGKEKIVRASQLLNGDTKTCGNCPPTIKYFNEGNIMRGECTNGTKFIFDEEDYDKIKGFQWCNSKGYICSTIKRTRINLHRLVLGVVDNALIVDHINGNKLDCRKKNLRIVTKAQNNSNRNCPFRSAVGLRGVDIHTQNGKYRVRIGHKNMKIHLGCYETADEAAYARNVASEILHGTYKGKINDTNFTSKDVYKKVINIIEKYRRLINEKT